jgi:hypothetical protein
MGVENGPKLLPAAGGEEQGLYENKVAGSAGEQILSRKEIPWDWSRRGKTTARSSPMFAGLPDCL